MMSGWMHLDDRDRFVDWLTVLTVLTVLYCMYGGWDGMDMDMDMDMDIRCRFIGLVIDTTIINQLIQSGLPLIYVECHLLNAANLRVNSSTSGIPPAPAPAPGPGVPELGGATSFCVSARSGPVSGSFTRGLGLSVLAAGGATLTGLRPWCRPRGGE